MSQRVQCPIKGKEDYWIDLPDEWLGRHASLNDAAVDASNEKGLGTTERSFASALAMLDDFALPGLNGNPDKWDFEVLPLSIISWVNGQVIPPFLAVMRFPQLSSTLLQIGLNREAENQAGDSEE